MSASLSNSREKHPILILSCQRDSHPFDERTIILNEEVKVGRPIVHAKPANNNAIFNCKVLSRNHAGIWYESGQFFLRDCGSSNGTFVNNTRLVKEDSQEQPVRRIFSGDIIRFGVDVVEKNVTHNCIIARISLFYPNGLEAKPCIEPVSERIEEMIGGETLNNEQVFRLTHYIDEALFREQLLDSKLQLTDQLLDETKEATEMAWQAMLNEERLLEKLDLYENQLTILKKDLSEDSLQAKLLLVLEEKSAIEKNTSLLLERLLNEKSELMTKMLKTEISFENMEKECAHLRKDNENVHEAYRQLACERLAKEEDANSVSKQDDAIQVNSDNGQTELKYKPSSNFDINNEIDSNIVNGLHEDQTGDDDKAVLSNCDMVLTELADLDMFCSNEERIANLKNNDMANLDIQAIITEILKLCSQSVHVIKSLQVGVSQMLRQSESLTADQFKEEDNEQNLGSQVLCNNTSFTNSLLHIKDTLDRFWKFQTCVESHLNHIAQQTKSGQLLTCKTGGDFFANPPSDFSNDNEYVKSLDTSIEKLPEEGLTELCVKLKTVQREAEVYKQLSENLQRQDATKAELLFSVREECDVLKKRIAVIEKDLSSNHTEHQRLVSEARRARNEAQELKEERDKLANQVIVMSRQLDYVKSDEILKIDSNSTNLTASSQALPLNRSSSDVRGSFLSRLTNHSFSLFAVIPIMILICAFMVYIVLNFPR